MDIVDFMIGFENEQLSEQELIDGFQELIDSGIVWQLQGFYVRTATALIHGGFCHPAGKKEDIERCT